MRLASFVAAAAALAAVQAAEARAAQPALHRGSRGALVRAWQRAMNEYASESGWTQRLELDGVFGDRTRTLTLRFERGAARGSRFRPVGLREWKVWIGSHVTSGPGRYSIRPGDFSGFVGWWQVSLNRWLRRAHRPTLVIDCIYGPRTEAATRLLQRAFDLRPTGLAGTNAWRVLERLDLTEFP